MCIIFQFPLGRHHLLCYNYLSLELIHSVELVYLLFLLVADQSWLTIQKIYFFAVSLFHFSRDRNTHRVALWIYGHLIWSLAIIFWTYLSNTSEAPWTIASALLFPAHNPFEPQIRFTSLLGTDIIELLFASKPSIRPTHSLTRVHASSPFHLYLWCYRYPVFLPWPRKHSAIIVFRSNRVW